MAIPRNLANIAPHVNASSTELVVNDGGANLDFRVESDTNANMFFVDGGENAIGINTNTPSTFSDGQINVVIQSTGTGRGVLTFASECTGGVDEVLGKINFIDSGSTNFSYRGAAMFGMRGSDDNSAYLRFDTANSGNGAERMRITSGGDLLVGKTSANIATDGAQFGGGSNNAITETNDDVLYINRLTSDGTLIALRQDNTTEGSITVSGSTVSYNGGHLSRWAQMLGEKDESLLKGTVMSNLDDMNVYIAPTTYWTEEDELPEGVNVGDVKEAEHEVENEQLNKVKVSDVEGDANVAGVFVDWYYDKQHDVDEINMAMTGDMIIRIAQGVTVQRGDLLMSAGDGTAKPQGDDIVRSKTIAKVTSTHVTCTYDDGSYCVPCVLMAC